MKKKKSLFALLVALCMVLGMTVPAFAATKASVKLSKSKVSITVGNSTTLTAKVTGKNKKVTWKSSKPSVASVSSKGKVTGKKAGTAVITAKANGKTAKCTVTVKKKTISYVKQGEYSKINAAPRPGSIGAGDFVTVQKLSGGKIKFVAEHYGVNGSPIYQTNVITAKLSGNKVSKFSWKDTWGNSGTGSLVFGKNKVTLKMKTTVLSKWNRWGWQKSLTLPFEKSMTTAVVSSYLKKIG
ncbi:Ig domain-containing protein [Ruminococcus sp. 5_1_39BFAA]|uniref:Ig-like domain-containing protein n=1 Tax=Ruminococcus sp. 5_1_39BFAA TaxID=457412 RepID=UPI00356A7C80